MESGCKEIAIREGIDAIVDASIQHRVDVLKVHVFEAPLESLTWNDIKMEFLMSLSRIPDIRVQFLDHGLSPEPLKHVTIFTDGGAEPNPGVGGYGVVLRFGNSEKELSQGFKATTNNRMELLAAIVGLESLKQTCAVRLYSDSRYIVDSVTTGGIFRWRQKNWKNGKTRNADLWERFVKAYIRHQVEMVWVKGHAGITDNERCDQLASAAMKSADLQIDEGYEKLVCENGPMTDGKSLLPGVESNASTGTKAGNSTAANVSARPRPNRKRDPKPKQIGDPCRNCGTALIRWETKKSKPDSAYNVP